MKKTKFLVSGDDQDVLQKSGEHLCAVCCSGVSRNSILCSQCMLWVHKTSSGITKWLVVTQTMSAIGVRVILGKLMAGLRLKWMSTAPCLMWKPLSATLVICCALVGAVTVPLLCGLGKVQETLACPNLQTPLIQDMWQGVCSLHLLSYASCISIAMNVPWSVGSVASKTEMKHPQLHYNRNLTSRTSHQSYVLATQIVWPCTTGHILYQFYHKLSDFWH